MCVGRTVRQAEDIVLRFVLLRWFAAIRPRQTSRYAEKAGLALLGSLNRGALGFNAAGHGADLCRRSLASAQCSACKAGLLLGRWFLRGCLPCHWTDPSRALLSLDVYWDSSRPNTTTRPLPTVHR